MLKGKLNGFYFGILVAMFGLAGGVRGQSARPVPSNYSSGTLRSYVRVWDAAAPEQTPAALITRPLKDVRQTTQYFDGLGRPLQTVVKQGSYPTGGSAADMVSMVEYDAFGREQFKYLSTVASTSDGVFKLNPFAQQAAFFASGNTASPIYNQGETFFYNQTVFEASPLNRVQEAAAPGNNWAGQMYQPVEVNRRSIKMKYYVNTVTDAVRIWNVTPGAIGVFSTYASPAAYTAGLLYKNISIDEHGKQVIEFKDKEGKVILKKVQLTATADNGSGSAHSGWLCTYYLYDDLNNLRCIIQPGGVELISPNWILNNATILADQCFRYEYDGRNRMIVKKVPGAGKVDMVYDVRDRLIMMQDAKILATTQYMVTKYDLLNRPIETGLWTSATAVATHRTSAAASTSYPTTSGTYEELTKTFYDNYDWVAANGGMFTVTRNTQHDSHFLPPSNTVYPYPQPLTQSFNTRGMVTGTRTKVLGTSQYLWGIIYYDNEGREIQRATHNVTGLANEVVTQYDFSGKVLRHFVGSRKNLSISRDDYVLSVFEYDDLGRMLSVKKTTWSYFNSTWYGGNEKEIVRNEYDALGQLKKKKLAPDFNAGAGLESLVYDYNIRGWMLGMNKAYISAQGQSGTTRFGFELGYDKLSNQSARNFSASQFNGNITGMVWKSDGDDVRRKYDFTYDAANRLMQGLFEQDNAVSSWNNTTINYTVKMGDGINANSAYDYNGNIKAMTQFGWKLGVTSTVPLDNMRYTYILNTNKLKSVKDFNNDALTKLGDFKTNTSHPQAATKTALTTSSTQAQFDAITDYTYDVNGNLTLDNNKTIGSITYNYLNLPSVITVTGKGTITYTYDATGNKLKKVVTETGQAVKTTLYIDGAVYENDVLQFLGHEGRIRWKPENNTFNFDYFLKDHLGNVRIVLTEEQQQDQYPAATMEGTYSASAPEATSMINYEKKFYTVNNTYVVNSSTMPGWTTGKDYANNNGNPPYNLSYPGGTTPAATAISAKVYKLNATTNKTGLGMVLKVMAGDKIDIHGKSYYQSATTYNNANSTLLSLADLIGAFIGSPDNAGFIGKGISSPTMQTINTGQIPATFFRGNDNTSSAIPKAYINYVFFDEQFKYVGGSFSRVGSSGTVKNHWFTDGQLQNIPVTKNGYLYVYVSNESNDNVFFDNLQVFHTRGSILEETHYYPFGLIQQGISSKALSFGGSENKYKYNSKEEQRKEFSDGSGLEWLDYGARMYDNQIGRWNTGDPMADFYEGVSPYCYALNDPINAIDPDGNLIIFVNGLMVNQLLAANNPWRNIYPGARAFTFGAPIYNGKKFTYGWGNEYIPGNTRKAGEVVNAGVGGLITNAFDDHHYVFISATDLTNSTGGQRYNEGVEYGNKLIELLANGNLTLADGETIKIVGHSQGGAFAAGIASVLAKHQKYSSRVEAVFYIAPHEPNEFSHPSGINGYQWSTESDQISSKNRFWKGVKGNSKFAKIDGVKEGNFYGRKNYDGDFEDYGGHSINTYYFDLLRFFLINGYPVDDASEPVASTPAEPPKKAF